jgi:hypothetical protein
MIKVKYNPTGLMKPKLPAAPKPTTPYSPSGPAVPPPAAPSSLTSNTAQVSYNPVRPPDGNMPQDYRRNNPTPNDRPMPQAPTSQVPMPQGKTQVTPKDPSGGRGIVPPPVGQRDEPRLRVTPPTPIPAPPPVLRETGPVPYTPPVNTKPIPDTGPVKPPVQPTQAETNKVRRKETTQERIDRLKAMRRAGNRSPKLDARIVGLKNRRDAGEDKPHGPKQDKVQLDDDPSTWNSEARAELALPRGMDTMFYDNPEGDAQNKLAQRQKDKVKKGKPVPTSQAPDDEDAPKPKDKDNADTNERRQGEDLADRLKVLEAKYKKNPSPQLKKRIAALKKRIAAGDTTGRNKNQPGTPQRPYRNREVSYRPLAFGGEIRI